MAENNNVHESSFGRMKEHIRHGADRMKHMRFSGRSNGDGVSEEDHLPLAEPPARSEETPAVRVDRSNVEDFPYDECNIDEFTAELTSGAVDVDDGVSSPKSQCSTRSMDTMNSSEHSWTSNQKTVSGLGVKEKRSRELLGPYKHNERILGPVPSEYNAYIQQNNGAGDETTLSEGDASVGRSPSGRSISDSLYADLSSISDRDLQVPDGLIEAHGLDSVSEGSTTPKQNLQAQQHMSELKLNE